MNAEQELVGFLSMHPELKTVAKSSLLVSVLEFIHEKQPCSFGQLRDEFSFIPFSDLKLIVGSLEGLELIKKSMDYGNEKLNSTSLAREFLEKCSNAKE